MKQTTKLRPEYFILAAISSALIGFTNCSGVEFEEATTESSTAGTDVSGQGEGSGEVLVGEEQNTGQAVGELSTPPTSVPPVENPEEILEIKEEVAKNCQTKFVETQEIDVYFPDPQITNPWGLNGDQPISTARNGYFSGRNEQQVSFSLPSQSEICDIQFSFDRQPFIYDDHFMLTFNNHVLASSYNFSSILKKQTLGLSIYNWSDVFGQRWLTNSSNESQFCAQNFGPGNSCSWPRTDTPGQIELDLDSAIFQTIMATERERTNHEFKFITVGDNDRKDGEHSDLGFKVLVSFVRK